MRLAGFIGGLGDDGSDILNQDDVIKGISCGGVADIPPLGGLVTDRQREAESVQETRQAARLR